MFQKMELVCGSVSLDDQGHLPRPRGEDLLRQLYVYDRLQYRIQHLEAWTSHQQPSTALLKRRE
jgi:hypothetical protein